MNLPTYANLGEFKAHHMPEEYYEKWDRLFAAYRRAKGEAKYRAQQRLNAHQNKHSTN